MALSSFSLISKSDKKWGERGRGMMTCRRGLQKKKKHTQCCCPMSFKNVQWCDSNCSRLFTSFVGFNNTDTISSISWYDRWLTMEIFHVWYKCPPWMYLRFAVTSTANIISWRTGWHYFGASCFCRHGVSASMWKKLNSEQIKRPDAILKLSLTHQPGVQAGGAPCDFSYRFLVSSVLFGNGLSRFIRAGDLLRRRCVYFVD